ncbi:MAG TPA: hypothetical protein VL201_03050 [Patescibacteria group bacterium]|jgi:hypothetical protein|nr:hypothetical protein [Patescibacteria group bacterium]
MISLKSADLLIRIFSFLFAYLSISTIPTAIRSRIAAFFGDDTSEQFGLSSFNPLHHVDFVGLSILVISSLWGVPLGWGQPTFNNPFNIHGSYTALKKAIIYFSDVTMHFILALMGIVFLELIFGLKILVLVRYMILSRDMSHMLLAKTFMDVHSLLISVGFILIVTVYLHIILGVIYVILNGRDLYLVLTAESEDPLSYELSRTRFSNFFISLLLLFIFGEPLRFFIVSVITNSGLLMGIFFGIH